MRDYANLDNGVTGDASKWAKMLNSAALAADTFPRMHGSEVNAEWLERDEEAMTVPVLIETPEGLGMDMPEDSLTVKEIAEMLGEDTSVEVIGALSSYPTHPHNILINALLKMLQANQDCRAGR